MINKPPHGEMFSDIWLLKNDLLIFSGDRFYHVELY